MGYIFRAIKKEIFSLATIFLVFIPALNNTNTAPTVQSLMGSAQSFVSAPEADVRTMLSGIGQTEANAVMNTLNLHGNNTYSTGHAPIFLAGTTTY